MKIQILLEVVISQNIFGNGLFLILLRTKNRSIIILRNHSLFILIKSSKSHPPSITQRNHCRGPLFLVVFDYHLVLSFIDVVDASFFLAQILLLFGGQRLSE